MLSRFWKKLKFRQLSKKWTLDAAHKRLRLMLQRLVRRGVAHRRLAARVVSRTASSGQPRASAARSDRPEMQLLLLSGAILTTTLGRFTATQRGQDIASAEPGPSSSDSMVVRARYHGCRAAATHTPARRPPHDADQASTARAVCR